MELYSMSLTLRPLSAADSEAIEHVRQFFRNYAGWLGVDLGYQNFAEEMASLPGAYSPRRGACSLPRWMDSPPVASASGAATEGVCEMKRLYVEPESAGQRRRPRAGPGAIKAAKSPGLPQGHAGYPAGHAHCREALSRAGFHRGAAYYPTPIEGTMFLALDLENWSEVRDQEREPLPPLRLQPRLVAQRMRQVDPGFFEKLSTLQNPEYLWIGCSDSRVPANEIIGLLPGEVFVHRNVANVVVHTDLNCLSVIQFAVDVLKVKHIMVVGHYGCGGVKAALKRERVGLVDLWLRHVQDVHVKHLDRVELLPPDMRHDRLCELNALEQVVNVCQTIVVQDAWKRGQRLTVHGWVYGLKDGLIRDLGINVACASSSVCSTCRPGARRWSSPSTRSSSCWSPGCSARKK
jgi:carbonic anhydrase